MGAVCRSAQSSFDVHSVCVRAVRTTKSDGKSRFSCLVQQRLITFRGITPWRCQKHCRGGPPYGGTTALGVTGPVPRQRSFSFAAKVALQPRVFPSSKYVNTGDSLENNFKEEATIASSRCCVQPKMTRFFVAHPHPR